MPDYQKQHQENGDGENGENGAVAVFKPPNMMAAAVKNNQGSLILFEYMIPR